jgi:3-dehydroquinate dehydratase type I
MKINYCLPIIKTSKKEVLHLIKKYSDDYQYFEIWLEPIKDLDDQFIKEATKAHRGKLIFLFQRGNIKRKYLDAKRIKQIINLLDKTSCYLDLDISETPAIDYLKKNKISIKTIISFHDYKETPANLAQVVKLMDRLKPTIYKIATKCDNETDAIKLLLLQQNLKMHKKRHIVLGMGNFGKITRIFGTAWGNELIYAPVTEQDASAPGQLTKQALEKIYQEIMT